MNTCILDKTEARKNKFCFVLTVFFFLSGYRIRSAQVHVQVHCAGEATRGRTDVMIYLPRSTYTLQGCSHMCMIMCCSVFSFWAKHIIRIWSYGSFFTVKSNGCLCLCVPAIMNGAHWNISDHILYVTMIFQRKITIIFSFFASQQFLFITCIWSLKASSFKLNNDFPCTTSGSGKVFFPLFNDTEMKTKLSFEQEINC